MARRRFVASILLACALAGCGVRAPRPLDVSALIRERGAADARGELEVRVLDDPRNVQLRLALAQLADQTNRPSQAIEQLEAVVRLGGPIGTRWHAADRARMARLLAARGRIRLARGAPSAHDDLQRARDYGASIEDDELLLARAAIAIARLHHIDAEERARGTRELAELASTTVADPAWIGAKPQPVPRDRGLYGIWLWEHGARRAAWEALRAWRDTTPVIGGPVHDAYLRAFAWWHAIDARPPATADLIGPERCRFPSAAGCDPAVLLRTAPSKRTALDALLAAPLARGAAPSPVRTFDPPIAAAWVVITLPQALRGEVAWGAAIVGRVDVEAVELAGVPAFARPVIARLTGQTSAGVADDALADLSPDERLVVAATRVLDGASAAQIRTALGDNAATAEGAALLAMIQRPDPPPARSPFEAALEAYVAARGATATPSSTSPSAGGTLVGTVIAAYRRDAAVADRHARDFVAESVDAAAANAILGHVFEALADPARARAAWDAAVVLSPEPAFLRGLALAAARSGDPDAGMIHATTAAAAIGDPAAVWIDLARTLEAVGDHVRALEAARSAIDLAGADLLPAALDVAIAASEKLSRTEQARSLKARRARLSPPVAVVRLDDPTDASAALAASAQQPTVSTIARMWVASRWNPRNVEIRAALLDAIATDDPRRRLITAELIEIAGDRDDVVARAAVAALR